MQSPSPLSSQPVIPSLYAEMTVKTGSAAPLSTPPPLPSSDILQLLGNLDPLGSRERLGPARMC